VTPLVERAPPAIDIASLNIFARTTGEERGRDDGCAVKGCNRDAHLVHFVASAAFKYASNTSDLDTAIDFVHVLSHNTSEEGFFPPRPIAVAPLKPTTDEKSASIWKQKS
jgi:hypothetical protein